MTSSYFDPTYSSAPGGWTLPKEAYPAWKPDPGKEFNWTTGQEKKENNSFIDTHLRKAFEDQIGSY